MGTLTKRVSPNETVSPESLSDVVDQRDTSVLLAVCADAQPTYGTLCERTGLSKSRLQASLLRLRALGLVDWQEGTRGSIRPKVGVVVTVLSTNRKAS